MEREERRSDGAGSKPQAIPCRWESCKLTTTLMDFSNPLQPSDCREGCTAVQPREWLIQEENGWPRHEREGYAEAALLTPREFDGFTGPDQFICDSTQSQLLQSPVRDDWNCFWVVTVPWEVAKHDISNWTRSSNND